MPRSRPRQISQHLASCALSSRLAAAFAAASILAAGPVAAAPTPEPTKAVDITRYLGRWYEMARLHNRIEERCASSTVDYGRDSGGYTAVETCRHAGPGGGSNVWRARVRVLDPGRNTKLRLSFFPLVSRDYWVLDHADDYSWAVVSTSNSDGRWLWLFTRRPDVPAAQKAMIVARARALGYDTSKLIYDR